MAQRPPWYSFLYGLLGAHGTFWLWVVTVATLWFTWRDAVLSLVNRYPERRNVVNAANASDLRRWVVSPGVRLVLDGQLLLKDETTEFQGTEILIDQDDPCARYWRTTRAIADVDAGVLEQRFERSAAGTSEVALAGGVVAKLEARQNLITRRLQVQTHRAELLPKPEGALLLLSDTVAPPSTESTSAPPAGSDTEDYDRLVTIWRDAVRAHVSVGAPRGLLDEAPGEVLKRIAADPGIHLGGNALKVNRTPNDTELYVFCAGAFVFLFLATGLYGVVTAKDAEADPARSP